MKIIIRLTICLMLGLGLTMSISSCNGAKAYVKKAKKMEAVGMMEQAAAHYMTALRKKPENLDAITGLKRTGQIVLLQHLADFDEALIRNDRESAINAFQKAEKYFDQVKSVRVTLEFPASKRAMFESVKNAHVQEIYVIGADHLKNLRYDEALEVFENIEELVPGFKDAKELGDYCYCKPRYEEATGHMEHGMFRSAHKLYSEIVARDASYEDAQSRLQESLNKGKYTVALMKFNNGTTTANVNNKLSAYVEQSLMDSSDPFLTIVDRESLELILQEQHLEMSGLTAGSELEIGSLLGAKAILKGTVMDCSYSRSSLHQENQSGFEKYRVEKINSEGKKYYETKYKPTSYRIYNQSGTLKMSFNLKMISMETGAIIKSETVQVNLSDQINYAYYGGNKNNLYPTRMNGTVDSSVSGHNGLIQLIGARRDLKSENTMVDDATKNLALKVQSVVESILLQTVK
ncbi:MAG: hypothetical protein CL847_07030 [Crocinitomicaceae bacterium]|nr:hypothetical protein [Crocinitomicaceae bacterium]